MRVSPLAAVASIALASCASLSPPRGPGDLQIAVVLKPDATDKARCVVSFVNPNLKQARHAVAYTGYAVIWRVDSNACGNKKKDTPNGKALGLKHLKLKGQDAAWFDRCSPLTFVPGHFTTSPTFRCDIPPKKEGDVVGLYEYELDGDSIRPEDPDLDVRGGR